MAGASQSPEGEPEGSPYDWYRRAVTLLEGGNPDAAEVLLARLRELDPGSNALLEAHARALFDSRRYEEAAAAFSDLVDRSPSEDYAHYGLGLALWRLQRFPAARDHLAMAAVMRPEQAAYATALAQVRATLRARSDTGLPLEGPVSS